jgi:hypothetical protein
MGARPPLRHKAWIPGVGLTTKGSDAPEANPSDQTKTSDSQGRSDRTRVKMDCPTDEANPLHRLKSPPNYTTPSIGESWGEFNQPQGVVTVLYSPTTRTPV